jgi:hypothetical protein
MSERTYRYGVPGKVSAETLVALTYQEGVGRLVVDLRSPFEVPGGPYPLVHEQFALQPADIEWWNGMTGRRAGPEPGEKRRAQFWQLNLWLDSGRCLCMPVTLHRPLKPGAVLKSIHLFRQPRGHRRPLTLVTFILEADEQVWEG